MQHLMWRQAAYTAKAYVLYNEDDEVSCRMNEASG